MTETNRIKKVLNGILDEGANELETVGKEAVHVIIQEIKGWVINRYCKFKGALDNNPEQELKKLEMRIAISNESVTIGMEKKELAVMWAMRKLGYSEEETQQVLSLANQAYYPKEQN